MSDWTDAQESMDAEFIGVCIWRQITICSFAHVWNAHTQWLEAPRAMVNMMLFNMYRGMCVPCFNPLQFLISSAYNRWKLIIKRGCLTVTCAFMLCTPVLSRCSVCKFEHSGHNTHDSRMHTMCGTYICVCVCRQTGPYTKLKCFCYLSQYEMCKALMYERHTTYMSVVSIQCHVIEGFLILMPHAFCCEL